MPQYFVSMQLTGLLEWGKATEDCWDCEKSWRKRSSFSLIPVEVNSNWLQVHSLNVREDWMGGGWKVFKGNRKNLGLWRWERKLLSSYTLPQLCMDFRNLGWGEARVSMWGEEGNKDWGWTLVAFWIWSIVGLVPFEGFLFFLTVIAPSFMSCKKSGAVDLLWLLPAWEVLTHCCLGSGSLKHSQLPLSCSVVLLTR